MSENAAFKSFEHQGWKTSVEQYHRSFGKLTSRTIPALLDAVGEPGESLLDVACGPGYLTHAATLRGWDAEGVDFSEEMIAKARILHRGSSFRLGDAEKLPYGPAAFDAVLMNFGILHLADPERALAEAFRVMKPGGHLAFTVWAPPTEALGFAVVLAAVEAWGDSGVNVPPGPPFFRYSDPEAAAGALRSAGFCEVLETKLPLVWNLESPEELFNAFYLGTARTGGLLRAQPPERLGRIKEAVCQDAETHFQGPGGLAIPMPAWVYSARKPLQS